LIDLEEASFSKVNYLIRPSKQVERKLFIEALHRLSGSGFTISNYIYVGLGSVYYADFILFHKYLYVDNMICAESAPIPKRMDFNRAYRFITLEMGKISNVIPRLDREKKHIIWLDYDCNLNEEILKDITGCLHVLSPGSILVITVKARPELPNEEDYENLNPKEKEKELLKFLENEFGRYHPSKISSKILSPKSFPNFLAEVLRTYIFDEIKNYPELEFKQIFNFKYADGAPMLTLGGVICDQETERKLADSEIEKMDYIEVGPEPMLISVPHLTIREKQWLDREVKEDTKAEDLPFELEEYKLENYKKYYRHYPTYYETLA